MQKISNLALKQDSYSVIGTFQLVRSNTKTFLLLKLVVYRPPDTLCCLRLSLPSVNWKRQKGCRLSLGIQAQAKGEPRVCLQDLIGKESANIFC